ncbi:SAM-dependent methyltransferase [Streptomyces catenulae]|uniref:SAM-dependent methyltransferase n=1 Tax=Streptomyces catenulae TaxID=66875 RepID=A0ABV2Z2J2_9ACTN|nr:SAM-dependent methyltransferase [Streptomyces catenulae]
MFEGEKPRTPSINMNMPTAARMYDWLLGGIDNYDVDKEACHRLLDIAPSSQLLARNNRSFLQRVIRILADDFGIDQFLDHGSGLPTQDNVHQIAQRINPDAKVVYVDNDPAVLAHARTRLLRNSNTRVLQADMRDTEEILAAAADGNFLNFGKKVAVLFVSVLHCLPDTNDDRAPAALIRKITQALAPGSIIVICQLVSDHDEVRDGVTELMRQATGGQWGRVRERGEVRAYFDGLKILPPGLCDVVDWRPTAAPPPQHLRPTDWVEWGGVAEIL